MNSDERNRYFIQQIDSLLIGGTSHSEWCSFISESVYNAFIAGADLATIITAISCIETYFKTDNPVLKNENLAYIIDQSNLNDDDKIQLQKLRKYRNSWVHADRFDETEILTNSTSVRKEVEEMAVLSVRLLLIVLFSDQMI